MVKEPIQRKGQFTALGIAIGTGCGAVFNNIGLGLGLGAVSGLLIGIIYDALQSKKSKKEDLDPLS